MANKVVVQASLGIMVVIAGFLALLSGLHVSTVDWRVAMPLFTIFFGVWIMLCATECHLVQAG